MASQTLVPTSIESHSGFSSAPTVAQVNSDNGTYATAASSTADPALRVGFDTPTGPPTTGAGLQTFNAKVRKTTNDFGETPTARLELWETGGISALATGTDTSVTLNSSDTTVTLTWDASLLATADGSAVECRLVCFAGGSGGGTRSVDVDYIEWVADYTVGVSGSVSEGVTAADGLATTGTFGVTQSEAVTASDALTGGLLLASTQTESVTAADSVAASIVRAIDLPIRAIEWRFGSAAKNNASGWTGSRTVVADPWRKKWRARVELAVIQGEANVAETRAFLARCKGQVTPFRLYATAGAQNANSGVTVSSTAAIGATSMAITGAATALLDGQLITVNGQLLCLTADQSGSTITFQPPLRQAASAGTTVVTSRPYALVHMAASSVGWQIGPKRLFNVAFDVEEAMLEADAAAPESVA